jgi:two-component system, chemotaxis family, CheB/CheR fusion protein
MKKPKGSRKIGAGKKISRITTSSKNVLNKTEFPVVGVGASAGGLEALEQFITNIPNNSGMSFVIVQHLDPTHKGLLPEILQRLTKMKVFQITDNMKIKPNSIYVIPPNRDLSIYKRTLHLFEMRERRGLRLPIDHFFRTLAENEREKSIAVILSGMGSDGTLGIRSIKEHNGLVFIQDPGGAKFDGMPRSAIDTGLASIVLSAKDIPGKISDILKHKYSGIGDKIISGGMESALEKIVILLRSHTGHDFSMYKKNTIYRRIERRMGIHRIDKIISYVRYLQENPKELEILFKELLIGVTNFFRDNEVWEVLKNKILPELLTKSPRQKVLRVWIPACSTGEEAYSLAIVFKEAIEKIKVEKNITLQIFATDIDNDAVDKARKGYFTANIAAEVSSARLKRFFVKDGSGYRAGKEIREMIIFARQNMIMDPPFTKLDLLLCRNLLIYLEPELQRKLFPLFHYSLIPEGVLILGNAESIGDYTNLFTPLNNKARIFRKNEYATSREFPVFSSTYSKQKSEITEKIFQMKKIENLQIIAEKLLLQKYSPPAVLVNDKGDILYISGSTGKYLEPAAGKANWNIFAMLREGLRGEFSTAFKGVLRNKTTAEIKNLKTDTNGGQQFVDVTIQYINKPEELQGMLMVIFRDTKIPADTKTNAKTTKSKGGKNIELELDLKRAREELALTLEEMQTSQEELKSTNEELQSTNEELQSTNEELTTSKEEMQSLNEELQTLNAELQSKVDEFSRSSNDMKNLLNSTDIATLFLDNDLNVRRFTTQVTKIIKLIPGDIGRPITDLSTELLYPGLIDDSKEVLQTLKFSEQTVYTKNGKCYSMRIMPYRTLENKIDGLVITFTDISVSKTLETDLIKTSLILRSLIKTAANIIMCLTPEGIIMEFNAEAEKLFGKKREDVIDKKFTDVFLPSGQRKKTETEIAGFFSDRSKENLETNIFTADGKSLQIRWLRNKLFNDNGQVTGIAAVALDITKK